MSRALERQLSRLERVLALPERGGDHPEEEWVTPEQALRSQRLLLNLVATFDARPPWFDERRAQVARMFPSAGYWRKRSSPEDERRGRQLWNELLEKLRSSSPIVQALQANPALRARLAAENRARLCRYLVPDDPLQLLLHDEDDGLSSGTELSAELDRLQLHPTPGSSSAG